MGTELREGGEKEGVVRVGLGSPCKGRLGRWTRVIVFALALGLLCEAKPRSTGLSSRLDWETQPRTENPTLQTNENVLPSTQNRPYPIDSYHRRVKAVSSGGIPEGEPLSKGAIGAVLDTIPRCGQASIPCRRLFVWLSADAALTHLMSIIGCFRPLIGSQRYLRALVARIYRSRIIAQHGLSVHEAAWFTAFNASLALSISPHSDTLTTSVPHYSFYSFQ